MVTREAIVAAARSWLGTPYHHQASVKGVGSDCLGLIRGIWRELYGPEPEAMPPYTPDWGSATGAETLLAAACRHLVKLDDVSTATPGDVLVFRMRDEGVAKHAGIIVALPASGLLERDIVALPATSEALSRGALHERNGLLERQGGRMVHAQEGLGVIEIELGRWWRRRAAAAFSFPGIA
jgi:NlpC/P60 family putative phage cell wall peptidase